MFQIFAYRLGLQGMFLILFLCHPIHCVYYILTCAILNFRLLATYSVSVFVFVYLCFTGYIFYSVLPNRINLYISFCFPRCSSREECESHDTAMRWLPYKGQQCTNITKVIPDKLQKNHHGKTRLVSIHHSYRKHFKRIIGLNIHLDPHIQC